MTSLQEIRLMRFDLDSLDEENQIVAQEIDPNLFPGGTVDRNTIISKLQLPEYSVLKLYYDGKLIPWSMISNCNSVDIQVFRPHQNVKSQSSEGRFTTDVLLREKVKQIESRIASLEAVADPSILSTKTEHDLQVLTKQISFLAKRFDLADQTEWTKKP